ncbi:MAG: hypothetical protein HZA50_10815 [Planctomycetes bacterium]|nr:hypothetical protein [Planctomycetota bacterium]
MSAIPSVTQSLGATGQTLTQTSSASTQKVDYLKLLITQLRNQDPTSPMDNNEMASQMAMFSQLEQLENLNKSATRSLALQQMSQASTMIGKTVTYNTETGQMSGRVQAVEVAGDEVSLNINNQNVALTDVIAIQN